MKKFALAIILVILAAVSAFSANLKMILDSNDGSSAFLVQDNTSREVARINSLGNVGIGTSLPVSTLEVNGDIKLASMSAPSAAPGKVYFDSTSSRLNYHDGTKWIEVDPAYSTREVKDYVIQALYTGAGPTAYDIATPARDIVITEMSMLTSVGDIWINNSTTIEATLYVGGVRKAYLNYYFQYNTYMDPIKGPPPLVFPIPIKVSAGTDISMTILGSHTHNRADEFRLKYMELPL
ncbi:MAG TPA: hypothetical protein VMD02_00845 [Candidatus Omnitrophota bacterium]|nr:hypothetical protein [Candidatus Omnitrophota bacterium]